MLSVQGTEHTEANLKRTVKILILMLFTAAISQPCVCRAAEYEYTASEAGIYGFSVRAEGDDLIIEFGGDSWWIQEDIVRFTYEDGSSDIYKLEAGGSAVALKTADWRNTAAEGSISYTEGSRFEAELIVPLSMLESRFFLLDFAGGSVSSEEIGLQAEKDEGENGEEDPENSDDSGRTALTADTEGLIIVDGNLSDWKNVKPLSSKDSYIDEWKAARDEDGNVYLSFCGTASNQWDQAYQWKNLIIRQNGREETLQFATEGISSQKEMINEANHNTPGPYAVELMIPFSYFNDDDFTIGVGDDSVSAAEIPIIDGKEAGGGENETYEGIAIDGKFADWSAVVKYDASEKDPSGQLSSAAIVFDGSRVFLYLEEQRGAYAYGAGSHHNGKYTITTDLGNTLVFTINSDDTISGPEAWELKHTGRQIEIAIPKELLPAYRNEISFGLYLGEELTERTSNLDGSRGDEGEAETGGSVSGIVYDGLFGDWKYFPTTIIEYATAGTEENVQDAGGTLYLEGSTLYGHVYSTMQRHLDNDKGNEFTTGVTIRFNNDANFEFYPRLVAVDENGNINWNPKLRDLPEGRYEFYIASRDAWGSSPDLSSLNEHDTMYGKMWVAIEDGIDECEFYIDLEKMAERFNCDHEAFKIQSAQFINIGRQWISTAGASTDPLLGIAICIAAALLAAFLRRRNAKREERA